MELMVIKCNSWNHNCNGKWINPVIIVIRIDFVTIASTGNANDFGDLYFGTRECGGCNSPTRGVVF